VFVPRDRFDISKLIVIDAAHNRASSSSSIASSSGAFPRELPRLGDQNCWQCSKLSSSGVRSSVNRPSGSSPSLYSRYMLFFFPTRPATTELQDEPTSRWPAVSLTRSFFRTRVRVCVNLRACVCMCVCVRARARVCMCTLPVAV